jgi:2-(1,2-epoxy-1,2-dihydrophenyl)acetyl-CoA isomerase
MYKDIIFTIEDNVATITLNRPEAYNALSDTMRTELKEVVGIINDSKDIRVVVLTGAGKAFCAGGDIKLMKERIDQKIPYQERLDTYRLDVGAMVKCLKSIRQPVIAKLNGATYGAGCSIAMLCDIRVAGDNVKLGLPFTARGLVPDWGATYFLPRLVGTSNALHLIATGKGVSAGEALNLGLVNAVVPAGELDDYVKGLCEGILLNGPMAVTLAKEAMYAAMETELDTALEREAHCQSRCYLSDDHREGVDCFLEKRPPQFKGV